MKPANFAIDNCIKCSLCNAVCPVYATLPDYPGPKHLGPELERMRLEGLNADTDWLESCLGCHRCDVACPHQTGPSEMIARAKGRHRKPFIRALRDWWFARPGLLGKMLSLVPPLTNFMLGLKLVRKLMENTMYITARRSFPAYTRPTLRTTASRANSANKKIIFFPGCSITYNRPDLGKKVATLLSLFGYEVQIAQPICCGVPAIANGDRALAAELAERNLNALAAELNAGTPVLAACASCGHQLKSGFGGVLDSDERLRPLAEKLAANTWDVGEFLLEHTPALAELSTLAAHAEKLAYHAPCHMIAQGMGRPWATLLASLPGVAVDDVNAGCCGMSGTYGFKQEKFDTSLRIGSELFSVLHASRPERVITECATCQMQIEHGTHLPVAHPVEILLEAYERSAKHQRAAESIASRS